MSENKHGWEAQTLGSRPTGHPREIPGRRWSLPHRGRPDIEELVLSVLDQGQRTAGTAWAPWTCRLRTPGSSATRRARKWVPESMSFKRNDWPERAQEPKRPSPQRLRSRSARKGTSRTMRPSGAKSTLHNGRHRSNNTPAEPHFRAAQADLDREARDVEPRPRAHRNDNRQECRHRRQWVSAELTKQLRESFRSVGLVTTPPCPTPKHPNSCLNWPASLPPHGRPLRPGKNPALSPARQ